MFCPLYKVLSVNIKSFMKREYALASFLVPCRVDSDNLWAQQVTHVLDSTITFIHQQDLGNVFEAATCFKCNISSILMFTRQPVQRVHVPLSPSAVVLGSGVQRSLIYFTPCQFLSPNRPRRDQCQPLSQCFPASAFSLQLSEDTLPVPDGATCPPTHLQRLAMHNE